MGLAGKAELDVCCNGSEHFGHVLSCLRTSFKTSVAVVDLGEVLGVPWYPPFRYYASVTD